MDATPDVHELFRIQDVTDIIIEKQEGINLQIEQAKEAISLKKSPPLDVGKHCFSPYPCDFIGHCWKNVPATSVFHLKGISLEKRLAWMQAGVQSADEIPLDDLTSEEKQIIEIHLSGKAWRNVNFARQIASIQKPLLITFLTIRPAVPLFEHCRPFQHLIVGFASKNQEGEMNVFLAEPGSNPIPEIEKRLTALFETHQHILYAEPESGMSMGEILNTLTGEKKFVDLAQIFQPENYYQVGIDPKASFSENLSLLLPEASKGKPVRNIMAGVKYLEAIKKKDAEVEELTNYLTENLHHLQILYEFLVNANEENEISG